MVVTRSMAKKAQEKTDIKEEEGVKKAQEKTDSKEEEGVKKAQEKTDSKEEEGVFGRYTLDLRAMNIYILETYVTEYQKKHPNEGYPFELSYEKQREWHSLSRPEKAPFLQKAREARAASREYYRKWKNGEL